MESHIAVFKGKEIRKTIYNNKLSKGGVQFVPPLLNLSLPILCMMQHELDKRLPL